MKEQFMLMIMAAILSNPKIMPEELIYKTSDVQKDAINKVKKIAEMAYEAVAKSCFSDENENELED